MGLAASQARLLMSVARKSDLELTLQQINSSRMVIANQVSQLAQRSADAASKDFDKDPTARPAYLQAQAQTAAIQQIDKVLEMEAQRVNTQHEAVQTEIAAIQKVIQRNIQGSFKLMG
jgi:2C-methyl-D-erythritol 2,4-cyclodiphosphate synthase